MITEPFFTLDAKKPAPVKIAMQKYIMKLSLKPWIFAFVGASLILASTFITGYFIFINDNEINNYNVKINELQTKYFKAEADYREANLTNSLDMIQRSIVRFSVFQDKEIQQLWDKAHVASLYNQVLSLYGASGKYLSDQTIDNFKNLRSQGQNGNQEAIKKFNQLIVQLTSNSGRYRGDLIVEKAELEIKKTNIEKESAFLKLIAIFVQIIGLVILLVKEIPIKKKQ